MTDIIIEGNFTVRGLVPQLNNVSQPLKYLKLKVAYPEPPIQVEAMSSIGRKPSSLTDSETIREKCEKCEQYLGDSVNSCICKGYGSMDETEEKRISESTETIEGDSE